MKLAAAEWMSAAWSGRAGVVLVAVLAAGGPVSAQYFGQNKVQYKTFDFEVMRTDHDDIYVKPAERPGV
jgi:hypothetical protein